MSTNSIEQLGPGRGARNVPSSRPFTLPAHDVHLTGLPCARAADLRLPDHASACAAARRLQREGLTTRAGVRHRQAYLTVRSERADVGALVLDVEPSAVRVDVEQLPRPLPHSVSLVC